MPKTNKFPNGFDSWSDTHFEVCASVSNLMDDPIILDSSPAMKLAIDGHGRMGLYWLARDLTTKFEAENQGREWDGEWWEVLDEFLDRELS